METKIKKYQIGQVLSFGKTSNVEGYLGHGWGETSDDHRWTIDKYAALHLQTDGSQSTCVLRLKCQAFLGDGKLTHQQVSVYVNDFFLGNLDIGATFLWYELKIPNEFLNCAETIIQFNITKPLSPKECGLSEDSRKLGIRLSAFLILPQAIENSIDVQYDMSGNFTSDIRCLEIGSGPKKRNGWLTLDMCPGVDIVWDLREKLPFENAYFKKVYCSHVLEHFAFQDLRLLLSEVNRILQADGEFIIAVPDASIYVEAYLGKRDAHDLLKYKPAVVSSKAMDILNYMFYMEGHHKFMFDAENLAYHCQEAGFENCLRRPFDPHLDHIDRDYESLYMSCRKPSAVD